MYEEIKKFF
jgi:hypothetical protein